MITRTKQRHARTIALLAMSIAVTACTSGNDGIFATIAIERRSTSRNLNDRAGIFGVAQTAGRVFTLAGNQVFWRDLTSDTWNGITTPSVSGGSWRAIGLAGLDTDATNGISEELYVHAQLDGGARTAVFRMSGTGYGPIVLDTAAGGSPVRTIGGMQTVKDKLVVSVERGDGTYRLYSFDAGFTNGWAAADEHPLPAAPVGYRQHIVDSDASATTAVFVGASGGLFRLPLNELGSGGGSGTALTALDPAPSSPGEWPSGIDFGLNVDVIDQGSGNTVVVPALWIVADRSNNTGRIFINESPDPNDGTWVDVDTNTALSFSDALWLDGTNAALLVGTFTNETPNPDTLASGLRIINLTRTNATTYRGSVSSSLGQSYRAVRLSNAAIRSLNLLQTTLYAQTSGSGLWSVPSFTETSPDNREWIWE